MTSCPAGWYCSNVEFIDDCQQWQSIREDAFLHQGELYVLDDVALSPILLQVVSGNRGGIAVEHLSKGTTAAACIKTALDNISQIPSTDDKKFAVISEGLTILQNIAGFPIGSIFGVLATICSFAAQVSASQKAAQELAQRLLDLHSHLDGDEESAAESQRATCCAFRDGAE